MWDNDYNGGCLGPLTSIICNKLSLVPQNIHGVNENDYIPGAKADLKVFNQGLTLKVALSIKRRLVVAGAYGEFLLIWCYIILRIGNRLASKLTCNRLLRKPTFIREMHSWNNMPEG